MNRSAITTAFAAAIIGAPAMAGSLGPTTYTSVDDSPFKDYIGTPGFVFEDFEDLSMDTPGATASGSVGIGNGIFADSVDADGASLYIGRGQTFTLNFDAGSRPTHAGLVWTDGFGGTSIKFYDENDALLHEFIADHGDGSYAGTTDEDRFYGVTNQSGIGKIMIQNLTSLVEIDHLQYGSPDVQWPELVKQIGDGDTEIVSMPTPSAALAGMTMLGFLAFRRKRA